MKKYSEFVYENNLNEGFFKNLLSKVGSFFSGSKSKIEDKVSKMVEIEKDFINKSDDLNYDIFSSESKKIQDPVLMNNARQKAMMSKRALEAMKIAKNAEINFLTKEIKEIAGNDPYLINFYQKIKTVADSDLAQYAYEKAKKFRDNEYEDVFYNQWKTLDTEAQKYRGEINRRNDSYLNIVGDSGMFDLSLGEFTSQISSIPKSDAIKLLDDAYSIKFAMEEDYKNKNMELRDLRNRSYKTGDTQTLQIVRTRHEDLKIEHRKNITSINNKISVLKNRVKNI